MQRDRLSRCVAELAVGSALPTRLEQELLCSPRVVGIASNGILYPLLLWIIRVHRRVGRQSVARVDEARHLRAINRVQEGAPNSDVRYLSRPRAQTTTGALVELHPQDVDKGRLHEHPGLLPPLLHLLLDRQYLAEVETGEGAVQRPGQ